MTTSPRHASTQTATASAFPAWSSAPTPAAATSTTRRLSHDAYVKFIEDDFLGGQRLDPRTDGRPDHRPTVRERARRLGDLRNDFNFRQRPRPPLILPTHPNAHAATRGRLRRP